MGKKYQINKGMILPVILMFNSPSPSFCISTKKIKKLDFYIQIRYDDEEDDVNDDDDDDDLFLQLMLYVHVYIPVYELFIFRTVRQTQGWRYGKCLETRVTSGTRRVF